MAESFEINNRDVKDTVKYYYYLSNVLYIYIYICSCLECEKSVTLLILFIFVQRAQRFKPATDLKFEP